MAKFSWSAFAAEILAIAPQIIQDAVADKSNFTHEQATAAAATAVMQASQVAQQIDPADSDKVNEAAAVAGTIIAAVRTPPPA